MCAIFPAWGRYFFAFGVKQMPQLKWAIQTPQTIMNVATELERIAANLRARAAEMQTDGIAELKVPNNEILKRGMEWIEKYAYGVRKEHIAYRHAGGEFHLNEKRAVKGLESPKRTAKKRSR